MIRKFLSSVPFVLIALAADNGGPSGGSPAASPPEPTGDTLDAKLASARSIIGDFFKQLGGAFKERDEAVGLTAGLKQNVTDLTAERDNFSGQVTAITTERDGLKSQVTGLTTERDTFSSRVTLIESFCKGKGLDLAGIEKHQAVKDVPEGADNKDGKAIYDEWQKLKDTNGKKATAFFRKHQSALKEYKDSLND